MMNREEVIAGIEKLRPWYQRIEFPDYDIATTDRPEWVFNDAAGDNRFGDMTPEDASKYRPQPKWERIRDLMPDIRDHQVLEVGCANGFYSFEMAKLGAAQVLGIDMGDWVRNAEFAKKVLQLDNVSFVQGDFFEMGHSSSPVPAERDPKNCESFLPDVDTLFISSALCHFLYPFYALHKLVSIPSKYFILDDGYAGLRDGMHMPSATFYWQGTTYGNVWGISLRLIIKFLWRVGISPSSITTHFYPADGEGPKRMLLIVDKSADQSFVSDQDMEKWGGRDFPRRFAP